MLFDKSRFRKCRQKILNRLIFLLDIYPGKEADSLTPFLTMQEGLPAYE